MATRKGPLRELRVFYLPCPLQHLPSGGDEEKNEKCLFSNTQGVLHNFFSNMF